MKFIPLFFLYHEKMNLREDDGDDDMFDDDDDDDDDDGDDDMLMVARDGSRRGRERWRQALALADPSHHFRRDDGDDDQADHVDHDGQ